MSHSDKDDFEKDPFDENSFGNDSFSENGKENDSGKSDNEPSFDELFDGFASSGSDSPDFSDFIIGGKNGGAAADGTDADLDPDSSDTDASPTSDDGDDFFDGLLNDSSAPQKDDTFAALAGLENLMGGKKDDGEDTASRLDAPKPNDDGENPAPSESSDFDFDFRGLDAAGDTGSESSGSGDIDTDFSEFGSDAGSGSSASGGDDDFDLDFLSPETASPEGEPAAGDIDSDSPNGLEGEGADSSGSEEPAADGGEPSLDDILGGDGAGTSEDTAARLAGLSADSEGQTDFDSDFFNSLQGTGSNGDSFPTSGDGDFGADLKPDLPEFDDSFGSGTASEKGEDPDFGFEFAAPESSDSMGEPTSSEEFSLDSEVIGGFGDDSVHASEEMPTEESSKDSLDFTKETDDDFLKEPEGVGAIDEPEDGGTTSNAEETSAGIDFSDSADVSPSEEKNESSLDDFFGTAPAPEGDGGEPSLDELLGGDGSAAPDDTAARLGSLQDMFGGDAPDDTAARLGRLSAGTDGDGGFDTDDQESADDGEDAVDTKTESADVPDDADFPSFDDEEGDDFAALNTGDSTEGESTSAALAGFEGLVSPDGSAAGEDTAALLGALSGEGEPAKDESTTAGLAGLEGLLDSGGDQREETAVRLSHLAEEQEEDESPDEQTLDDFLGEAGGFSESAEGDSFDSPSPFSDGGGSGDSFDDLLGDSGLTGGSSEFGGDSLGDAGTLFEAEKLPEGEEGGAAESEATEKGKKKKKTEKKKRRSRRRKEERNDPVSKLLVIPQVFFILYLILGNLKGILEWHRNGSDFFTLPFFLLAFNGTGAVLLLLPALLRAFRKRYAEDPKLVEYTLFMFMLAMAVAAMIMACHPLIFDLARNWGGPH